MRDRLQLHSLKWNGTCGAEPLVDIRTRGNRSNPYYRNTVEEARLWKTVRGAECGTFRNEPFRHCALQKSGSCFLESSTVARWPIATMPMEVPSSLSGCRCRHVLAHYV